MRMAKIQNTDSAKCRKDVDQKDSHSLLQGMAKLCSHLVRQFDSFLQN